MSFTPFETMWWDFEAVLVLVIPNIRPGLKPLELEISDHLRIPSFRSERDDRYCKYEHQIERAEFWRLCEWLSGSCRIPDCS